jgi:hypothetical protein
VKLAATSQLGKRKISMSCMKIQTQFAVVQRGLHEYRLVGSVNDVLAVEDDLAKAVAREIRVRLTPQTQAELPQSHPVNPKAFDAYLQGYYYFERKSDKDTAVLTGIARWHLRYIRDCGCLFASLRENPVEG